MDAVAEIQGEIDNVRQAWAWEVQGLLNLAWIALDANQYIVARKANEQALVIARQLGYRFGRILAPPLYSRIPVIDQ